MKCITVAIPDDVYRRARVRAAELETSVSVLVRDFLIDLGADESDFERRKKLQDEVLATVESFRVRDRLGRDEVHDRRALP